LSRVCATVAQETMALKEKKSNVVSPSQTNSSIFLLLRVINALTDVKYKNPPEAQKRLFSQIFKEIFPSNTQSGEENTYFSLQCFKKFSQAHEIIFTCSSFYWLCLKHL